MMRLRKKYGKGIKFYACGEYGEETFRPHYHACLFGVDFKDRELYKTTNDIPIYTSESLDKLWSINGKQIGFATIGEVTFQSASYVARYCMKKRKGKNWKNYYELPDEDQDQEEVLMLQPEFPLMSRRPGIGKTWLEKYKDEVLTNDSVRANFQAMKPPKYYDNLFTHSHPSEIEQIKANRRVAAKNAKENNTLARLYTRGNVKKSQIKQLKKEL